MLRITQFERMNNHSSTCAVTTLAGTAVVRGLLRAYVVPPSACLPLDDLSEHKTLSLISAGTWLMGVFPSQGCLVGFVHGEDHYKVQQ